MSGLVSTEAKGIDNYVKHEYPYKNYTREQVTVTVVQDQVLEVGACLGAITATGKYIVSVETAIDGSEAFGGILADLQDGSRRRTFTEAGDYLLSVVTNGPALASRNALETQLDASYDDDTKRDTYFAGMVAAGIKEATNQENF
jgi:hypothetical protein